MKKYVRFKSVARYCSLIPIFVIHRLHIELHKYDLYISFATIYYMENFLLHIENIKAMRESKQKPAKLSYESEEFSPGQHILNTEDFFLKKEKIHTKCSLNAIYSNCTFDYSWWEEYLYLSNSSGEKLLRSGKRMQALRNYFSC